MKRMPNLIDENFIIGKKNLINYFDSTTFTLINKPTFDGFSHFLARTDQKEVIFCR